MSDEYYYKIGLERGRDGDSTSLGFWSTANEEEQKAAQRGWEDGKAARASAEAIAAKIEESRENEEREASRRHYELIEAQKKEQFKLNNPGDYKCEACLLITLKKGASRCPVCRADVKEGYWRRIDELEIGVAKENAQLEQLAAVNKAKAAQELKRKAEEWRIKERARSHFRVRIGITICLVIVVSLFAMRGSNMSQRAMTVVSEILNTNRGSKMAKQVAPVSLDEVMIDKPGTYSIPALATPQTLRFKGSFRMHWDAKGGPIEIILPNGRRYVEIPGTKEVNIPGNNPIFQIRRQGDRDAVFQLSVSRK